MIQILRRMSVYISREDKSDYTGSCFRELDAMLEKLKEEALNDRKNHFLKVNDAYDRYVQIRVTQCVILKRVYADIVRISTQPVQTIPLAGFIAHVADEWEKEPLGEGHKLLREVDHLYQMYVDMELPQNREEFESRAMLYHILEDIRVFLAVEAV